MRGPHAPLRWGGCRIGFDGTPSDGGVGDGVGSDATVELDAAPGTRILTFGERPTSIVQNVTTDTSLYAGFDTGNFGISEDLSVYDLFEVALLRFDLSSLSSTDIVIAASLELVIDPSGDQLAGVLQLLRLDESWVEGVGDGEIAPGANWNDRGTGASWSTPGGTGTFNLASLGLGAIAGPISFDLPAPSVQGWIDTPASNHGVRMVSPDSGHWHPISRNGMTAGDRPQLRLVLQDP